eukprot:COSAG03_NODE_23543_length_279_cov_0.577778_1_plen_37_part_10
MIVGAHTASSADGRLEVARGGNLRRDQSHECDGVDGD